eukprot:TRINITY_DN22417_c0_g3_i1.p2 TRINITY_DN22417_c0_g3~~TRINITY_DN22417_c0_g3_i1.p2  ORF type:complete len:161 (-),score=10.96 TRINITY_DN22417_c0_g3_i1:68-550(-)
MGQLSPRSQHVSSLVTTIAFGGAGQPHLERASGEHPRLSDASPIFQEVRRFAVPSFLWQLRVWDSMSAWPPGWAYFRACGHFPEHLILESTGCFLVLLRVCTETPSHRRLVVPPAGTFGVQRKGQSAAASDQLQHASFSAGFAFAAFREGSRILPVKISR